MSPHATPVPVTLRLDKWLWFARIVRTRSLAARLCAAGCVTVGTRAAAKPHHLVRVGDAVTVAQAHLRRHLTVRELGRRRGPPAEARLLYDERLPPTATEGPAWTPLVVESEESGADQRVTQSL